MLNLLIINIFIVSVHLSGFFANLDDWVNRKFPPYHLPHILLCACCQTFWAGILYMLITGNTSLLWLMLCVLNALLTDITLPLVQLIINVGKRIIEWADDILNATYKS